MEGMSRQIRKGSQPVTNNIRKSLPSLGIERHTAEVVLPSEKNHLMDGGQGAAHVGRGKGPWMEELCLLPKMLLGAAREKGRNTPSPSFLLHSSLLVPPISQTCPGSGETRGWGM